MLWCWLRSLVIPRLESLSLFGHFSHGYWQLNTACLYYFQISHYYFSPEKEVAYGKNRCTFLWIKNSDLGLHFSGKLSEKINESVYGTQGILKTNEIYSIRDLVHFSHYGNQRGKPAKLIVPWPILFLIPSLSHVRQLLV